MPDLTLIINLSGQIDLIINGSAGGNISMGKSLKNHEMAGRSIKAVGWLQVIGVIGVYAAILIPIFTNKELPPLKNFLLLFTVILPVFSMIVGKAVKEQKLWARNVAMCYCILMLFGFPIGTTIGVYILYYLIKGWNDYSAEPVI